MTSDVSSFDRPVLSYRAAKRHCRQLAFMLRRKTNVHVLHISKTGGNAIRHALTPYQVGNRFVIHLRKSGIGLPDVPAGQKVCFFLRDPASRFVSGFHSRKRKGYPKAWFPWSAGEREAFEHFETPNELATSLSHESNDVARKAREAMHSIDHVRTPMLEWLGSMDYLKERQADIFFVGRQENLARDFETLKSMLEIPGAAALPEDNVIAHANPPDCDTALTPTAIENLKRWYEKDYELLSLFESGEYGLKLRVGRSIGD